MACLPEPALAFTFFGFLLAGWAYLRAARLDGAILGKIEYEEEMEPVVRTLGLFGTPAQCESWQRSHLLEAFIRS